MRTSLAFLAVLIFLTCLATQAIADVRIFDLKHRPAKDLLDAVQSAIGDGGRVTAIGHSLVVNGTREDFHAAEVLLSRLDHAPQMLRIIVGQGISRHSSRTNLVASGRISSEDASVALGSPVSPTRSGGVVVLGAGGEQLRVGTQTKSNDEMHGAEQFIVTLEGSPARINVGRRIPFSERWLLLARRYAPVVESVAYESVDTGFEVSPQLLGDMVQLDIRPYLAFQDRHRPRDIHLQELNTRVQVPLDQWFDLGGTMTVRDEVSREILGGGIDAGTQGGAVRVRVEIQPISP